MLQNLYGKALHRLPKLVGRGLVISAAASTVLGLLNVKRGYKIDTKPSKSQIDYKKEYVEN